MAGVLRKHEGFLGPAPVPGFHGCLPHSHAAGETYRQEGSAFWDLVGAESLGVWSHLWMRPKRLGSQIPHSFSLLCGEYNSPHISEPLVFHQ